MGGYHTGEIISQIGNRSKNEYKCTHTAHKENKDVEELRDMHGKATVKQWDIQAR